MDSTRAGIVIVNLGSPRSPAVSEVRTYLTEFLSDPFVISIPQPIRQFVVKHVIAKRRAPISARAYEAIWTAEGSPLLKLTRQTATALSSQLQLPVEIAMRYGEPTIKQALDRLSESEAIDVALMYPQHADSTRTTAIEVIRQAAKPKRVRVLKPFGLEDAYVRLVCQHIKEHLPKHCDHLLFSFHGLPEFNVRKTDPTGQHCLQSTTCCDVASRAHATCYRHQCLKHRERVGRDLAIPHSFSFQSRLGRLAWLKPYTDEHVVNLISQGVKNLAVYGASFVADNLETLHELDITLRQQFIDAGGEELHLLPCLNASAGWIALLEEWVRHPDEYFEEI